MSNSIEPLLNRGRQWATRNQNGAKDEDAYNESLFPKQTLQNRVFCFAACLIVGYIISLQAFIRFIKLLTGNPIPFIVSWTLGNIVSLCASCFLVGPSSQIKKLFHQKRIVAASAYVGSMFFTIVVAVLVRIRIAGGHKTPLSLNFILILLSLIQCASIAWYCVSFIPFAREGAKKVLSRMTRPDYEQII